jgi:hypothetical protein
MGYSTAERRRNAEERREESYPDGAKWQENGDKKSRNGKEEKSFEVRRMRVVKLVDGCRSTLVV